MARARNIKPGLYKNEDLAECSIWARYLFPGLWTLADREGRLEDRPKRIKAELLPFDGQPVEPLLAELAARGFLVRYQIDGASFIQISKFAVHQSPHYSEKKSVIKPPQLQENTIDDEIQNPRTAPEYSESEAVIKRGSQPPDSLIPDSLVLIPDSPKAGSAVVGKESAPAIAAALRSCGLKVSEMHPSIQQLAIDGVSTELAVEAVRIAKQDRGKDSPSIGYLMPIINDLRTGTANRLHEKPSATMASLMKLESMKS